VTGPAEVELAPRTLVVGDLHLDLEDEPSLAPFLAWLEGVAGAPRLVLLGDLFDVWLGPGQIATAGARRVLAALAATVSSGTAIDIVPGNRDFLLDGAFERASGCRVRHDGLVGCLEGGDRVLFLHGDELCTLDRPYQRLRAVLRSAPVRLLARWLPVAVARGLARRLRREAKAALELKPGEMTRMQPEACLEQARRASARWVVCGHAHRFRDELLEGERRWIVVDAFGHGPRDTLAVLGDGGGLAPLEEGS